MLLKLRAVLLGVAAVAGLLVVSAPAAQAATYTAVAQKNAYGRTVVLWKWSDGDRRCYHAEGRNMLSGEVVAVVKNESQSLTATSSRDGSNLNTGSLCGVGSSYHAALELRAPALIVYAGPWTE